MPMSFQSTYLISKKFKELFTETTRVDDGTNLGYAHCYCVVCNEEIKHIHALPLQDLKEEHVYEHLFELVKKK